MWLFVMLPILALFVVASSLAPVRWVLSIIAMVGIVITGVWVVDWLSTSDMADAMGANRPSFDLSARATSAQSYFWESFSIAYMASAAIYLCVVAWIRDARRRDGPDHPSRPI